MRIEQQGNGPSARGKREMHELALSAFTALQDGELAELLDPLQTRVLNRSPQELMDVVLNDGVWEWRFTAMIELLLLHIVATAGSPAMTPAERKDEILWAVEMAGF